MADIFVAAGGGGGVSSDELTARAEHVLAGEGYVGVDTDDEAGVGTMSDNGSMQKTLRAGDSVTVPRGFHDGSGTVTAVSLAEQTVGDAAPGDIVAGCKSWVRGARITGTMVEREGEQPTTGVTVSDGLVHVGMLPGAYRKSGRYGTPEVKAPVDTVARAAGLDGAKMLQGYTPLGVAGQIPVVNTMGPSGNDPRGCLATEYGIDFNARTLWMHAPYHNAYYMRPDGYPHICMDTEALGDATAQQALQGCTFTSKHGLKIPGAIYRWPLSGDIGGQRVMDAMENAAFAGDYGGRGRGVFMRMPSGSQIDPSCMWAWAPAPTILPQNIRAGTSVLGVPGSLVDYASTCVPFDGARFDGLHLSGWASGELSKNFFKASLNPTALFDGGYNRRWYSWSPWWGFTPSVHAGAFRAMRVTVHTYTDGVCNSMSLKLHLVRIGGVEHRRDYTPIRTATLTWAPGYTQGYIHTEWHTVEINCADINEQAFLVVNLQTDEIRPRGQANGYRFSADVTRVELIA